MSDKMSTSPSAIICRTFLTHVIFPVSSDGGDSVSVKQEEGDQESDSIRAQFFADLKRLKTPDPDDASPGADSQEEEDQKSSSQHSVTLKIREEDASDTLPPRKRKLDLLENGSCEENECKKVPAHEEDLDKSIKFEATSC